MTSFIDYQPTRRRILANLMRIGAGGALAGLIGLPPLLTSAARAGRLYRWSGVALGGEAHLWVEAGDRHEAAQLVARALAEKTRLERIFSLYRPDSLLLRLNAQGRLAHPPAEMLTLLALARRLWEASEGAFDPTVQPLYAWAKRAGGKSERPAAARRLVGMQDVLFDESEIAFRRRGMALTFNGIAQGYITDRVADLLSGAGCRAACVQFGEIRAFGRPGSGRGWDVRLDGSVDRLPVAAGAVAVTDTFGTLIGGHSPHVLDPRRRQPVATRRKLAVRAPHATLADGLSTALAVLGREREDALLRHFPDVRVRWLV